MHLVKWPATILLTITLTACNLTITPPAPATDETAVADEQCPAAAEDTALLRADDHGYCLLVPADYEVTEPNENEAVILAPPTTEGHRERAIITVSDGEGRSADEVADAVLADVAANVPGMEVKRADLMIDREPAVLLDNLPGQELNRRLIIVHDGQLIELTFIPADPAQADAYAEMEAVYFLALATLNFID